MSLVPNANPAIGIVSQYLKLAGACDGHGDRRRCSDPCRRRRSPQLLLDELRANGAGRLLDATFQRAGYYAMNRYDAVATEASAVGGGGRGCGPAERAIPPRKETSW